MEFDKEAACQAINEAFKSLNLPVLDRAVVRLIVEVASDCFDLGYRAAKRETVENE